MPDGWTKVDLRSDGVSGNSQNSTVSKETDLQKSGSAALKIEFAEFDADYRYTLMSTPFSGFHKDYVAWFWGKGGVETRLCYFVSHDAIVWSSTFRLVTLPAHSSTDVWIEKVDDPFTPTLPHRYMALTTHKFDATPSWWDDVSVTATQHAPWVGRTLKTY